MRRTGENQPLNGGRLMGASPAKEIKKTVKMAQTCEFIPYDTDSSSSPNEISLRSPDLTVCTASPDVPCEQMQETPDYIRRGTQRSKGAPIELFSDRDPNSSKSMPVSAPKMQSSIKKEVSVDGGAAAEAEEVLFSINSGGVNETAACRQVEFQRDNFYTGGDIIRSDAPVGALYQSARVGNFSYQINKIEPGDYLIDLHFAEIEYTDGPPGRRILNVFIQRGKAVSDLDIYSEAGANQPLVVSNLRASVAQEEGLCIRFQGIVGIPIVCGVSVRRHIAAGKKSRNLVLPSENMDDRVNAIEDQCISCRKLKQELNLLLIDQTKNTMLLEDLRQQNELKTKECHQAMMSLQELKTELMRKSMHVGSLAFAVEGQVKEKSRWFQYLRDFSEKMKLLKLEHSKLSEDAQEWQKSLRDGSQMIIAHQQSLDHYVQIEMEYKDLKDKYLEETKERKDLYNKLIELKGNIRVFCRCRPLNAEEIETGASIAVDFESAKDGELIVRGHVSSKKVFKFDSVFSPEENQDEVFEKTALFATSVLDGYNVCIFAYGQTGTGKTFTMEGTEEARGVNYRTLEELFRIIKERQGFFRYEITASVLEVYNEQINDLLLSGSPPGTASRRLEVRQVEGVHHVPGLVEAQVSNMNEAWEVLQAGSKARVVGATNANEHSSRSHCIHCVMVRGENLMNGECTRSKLWLIDLAGSERVTKTDAQGERLKEAQSINKSLSALGDVISALAAKSPHIPFRNSKLTHLLQDSLSGDSKTLMFVQISPIEDDLGETLCSLNFASRVRGIELGPAKRQVDISELSRYKLMVGKAKQDSKNKDAHIKLMEETIQSLEMKNKTKDMINKNLHDKIKELESQLLIERKLARQHVDNKIAEQRNKDEHTPILEKSDDDVVDQATPFKDLVNTMLHPVGTDDGFHKHLLSLRDKENKIEVAEAAFTTRARRVSMFNTTHCVPAIPASRRNSLAPLPLAKATAMPLHEATENPLPPFHSPMPCKSELRGRDPRSNKKINSILRRSLQKKVVIRPQLPQAAVARRGSNLQGLEKPRRAIVNNRANADRGVQKQQRKEKERGWNIY